MQLINKHFVLAKIVFYVTANHGYTTKTLLFFVKIKVCKVFNQDSIHYHDICRVTIAIVKIVLLLSTIGHYDYDIFGVDDILVSQFWY